MLLRAIADRRRLLAAGGLRWRGQRQHKHGHGRWYTGGDLCSDCYGCIWLDTTDGDGDVDGAMTGKRLPEEIAEGKFAFC